MNTQLYYGPQRAPTPAKSQPMGPEAPWDEKQRTEFLTANNRYTPDEAKSMQWGGNPMKAGTIQYPAPISKTPVKMGAGMAQKGLAISPDSLEKLRSSGIKDDAIADEMAKSSVNFATQLKKIRTKFSGDPAATTAFLNTRFYGDTSYSPSGEADKPKNVVTKALDYVYRVGQNIQDSAYDVLGEGGVMQQYNRGQLSSGQAALKSAGAIYHGALTPVLDPLLDATKYALDNTGGTQALQYGMQGAIDSKIGQAAVPYIQGAIEGYQNLPQDSGFRDLAVIGQAGMDTLGVLGAQSTVNMGKRAVSQSMHPLRTLRHPIQSANKVWSGKGSLPPDGGGGGGGEKPPVRELTGSAKEAVKKGMDEKLMTFVAGQTPDTRAVMSKMTKAANEGGKVLGGTVTHKEILGGQMMDSAAYVLDQKKIAGSALGAMKASVADDMVNMSDDYSKFLTELRNKGAVINDQGKIVSLAGAADDNIPILQKTLDFLQPDDLGNVVRTGKQIDMWRTKMFEEMNSAKAKLQQSSAGQSTFGFAEKLTNDVRRSALVNMAKGNRNMVAANDAFEELSTAASRYLKAIGYKGKLDIESITAKELRAGEVALRTLGNASADTRDAFMSLIETARKYGRVSNVDDMALIKYADSLEDLFPITPTRSLQGGVSRGTKDALGNVTEDVLNQGAKAGLTRAVVDKVGEGIKYVRGMTPENRFKLLIEVLDSPPDTPFFTIMEKVLPDEVVDDIGKSVVDDIDAKDMKPIAQKMLQEQQAGASQVPMRQGLQPSPTNIQSTNPLSIVDDTDNMSLSALSPDDAGIKAANDATDLMNQGKTLDQADAIVEAKLTKGLPRNGATKGIDDFGNLTPEEIANLTPEEKSLGIIGGGDSVPKLDSLNPTGGVYADYTPAMRAKMELGKNMTTLDKTMGKSPSETVTIYRGATKGQKNITDGDFITTNKQLAKDYAGDGVVLEKKVKLSDILDDATEPLGEEYIYRPMKDASPLPKSPLAIEARKPTILENKVTGSLFQGKTWGEFIKEIDNTFLPKIREPILVENRSSILSKNISESFGSDNMNELITTLNKYPDSTITIQANGYKTKLPKEVSDYYKSQLTDIWNKSNQSK